MGNKIMANLSFHVYDTSSSKGDYLNTIYLSLPSSNDTTTACSVQTLFLVYQSGGNFSIWLVSIK